MPNGDVSGNPRSVSRNLTRDLLRAVITWVEAMQGRGPLEMAVKELVMIAGADSACLIKHDYQNGEVQIIVVFDQSAGKMFSPRQWESLTPQILGCAISSAAPGSVWTKADVAENEGLAARTFATATPEPKEVVSIVIGNQDKHLSVLEFHYSFYPRPSGIDALNIIANHIAAAWGHRNPGISHRPKVRALETSCDRQIVDSEILTHENPCKLTKAEFRICLLVKEGVRIKEIARVVGSREKTVRGQLSSIYSKVEVEGQVELLFRLIASVDSESEQNLVVTQPTLKRPALSLQQRSE